MKPRLLILILCLFCLMPTPASAATRFELCGDGTVADTATGLLWTQHGSCFGVLDWSSAVAATAALASETCGLTDSSRAGEWRLPTIAELTSLISGPGAPVWKCSDFTCWDYNETRAEPAVWLSVQGFTSVQSYSYWSSTASSFEPESAWNVLMDSGMVGSGSRGYLLFVWPVRDGQGCTQRLIPVTIAIAGTGSGTVSDPAVGLSCGSSCRNTFARNSQLNMTAAAAPYSLFTGWTGTVCAGTGACLFTVSEPTTVAANFDLDMTFAVRDDGTADLFYSSLQDAFDKAADGALLRSWSITFAGVTLVRPVTLKVSGGYSADYMTQTGFTTISGRLTIGRGSLVVERVIIR